MKLKLDLDDLANDFFDNTRLIGIVAPLKSYQFCWHLNHLLHFDFRINNDIEIQLHKKKRHYYFSVFEYREPLGSLVHYLYNNQYDGEYLLPEFRHLDFLWLMKGDTVPDALFQQILNSVKTISGVQLVMELTNEKIKNKGHLIF
ncbi:IPExxxVDY family protein [Longitalea arenae]|uniref:IPExxxVDY family protein n=1 Tax=Longitalea arenae TaxID=2812558 RepID=UPI001967A449|nr:IPExxxVDY family protein [Longitalea arenae]